MVSSEMWVALFALLLTALWAIFVIQVPRNLRSLLRYRLWAIRDALIDDMLRGELPKSSLVEHEIRQIEATIVNSEVVTFLQFLFLPSPPKKFLEERRAFRAKEFKQLTEKQQAVLRAHTDAHRLAVSRHLFFGSFPGWIVLTLAGMIAVVVVILVTARSSVFSVGRFWRDITDRVDSFGRSELQPDRLVTARSSVFSVGRFWRAITDRVDSFGRSQLQPDRVQLLAAVSSKQIGQDRLAACL